MTTIPSINLLHIDLSGDFDLHQESDVICFIQIESEDAVPAAFAAALLEPSEGENERHGEEIDWEEGSGSLMYEYFTFSNPVPWADELSKRFPETAFFHSYSDPVTMMGYADYFGGEAYDEHRSEGTPNLADYRAMDHEDEYFMDWTFRSFDELQEQVALCPADAALAKQLKVMIDNDAADPEGYISNWSKKDKKKVSKLAERLDEVIRTNK